MSERVIEMVPETSHEAGPAPAAAVEAMRAWTLDPAPDEAPDFTEEWAQIRQDLEGEAAGALRIGQNLIKIRDRLKPLGLWLTALTEHGMSQPQASRYIPVRRDARARPRSLSPARRAVQPERRHRRAPEQRLFARE